MKQYEPVFASSSLDSIGIRRAHERDFGTGSESNPEELGGLSSVACGRG